jgi:hypothetical protein
LTNRLPNEGQNIRCATAWTGVDGFGKRKRSTVQLEGLTVNMPLLIEVIDEKTKLELITSNKENG